MGIVAQKPQKVFRVLDFVKARTAAPFDPRVVYIDTAPCTGAVFVSPNSPHFLHGKLAVHGNGDGRYPDRYLDFIDAVFGPEPNTIEVCSRTVKVDTVRTACTVDINPDFHPTIVGDAQVLAGVPSGRFNRWRSDKPYNVETAAKMYGTGLPENLPLLTAGARVCRVGSLLFSLLGPENAQQCPPGVFRVGLIYISVVPNNETRALNIYYKHAEPPGPEHYQGQLA